MKLYYSPGACSLSCHILLHEAGVRHEAVAVSLKDGEQFKPAYLAVNPKAKVPALARDDGSVLTELPAISYWIAASYPAANLLPKDIEGVARGLEWLHWMSGTVHNGGFSRITRAERFVGDPAHIPAAVEKAKADTAKYVEQMEARMQGRDYTLGAAYSFADPMLYLLTRWVGRAGKSLDALPALQAFQARMLARPAVQAALAAEGLS